MGSGALFLRRRACKLRRRIAVIPEGCRKLADGRAQRKPPEPSEQNHPPQRGGGTTDDHIQRPSGALSRMDTGSGGSRSLRSRHHRLISMNPPGSSAAVRDRVCKQALRGGVKKMPSRAVLPLPLDLPSPCGWRNGKRKISACSRVFGLPSWCPEHPSCHPPRRRRQVGHSGCHSQRRIRQVEHSARHSDNSSPLGSVECFRTMGDRATRRFEVWRRT